MFDEKTIKELQTPLTAHQLPGGKGYKYAKISEVIDKLNGAFDYLWSSEIVHTEQKDRFIVCHIAISVLDSTGHAVKKHGIGGAEMKFYSRGDRSGQVVDLSKDYASAFASALKQAAKQFGVRIGEDTGTSSNNPPQRPTQPTRRPQTTKPTMGPSPEPMPTRKPSGQRISGVDLVNQTMKNLSTSPPIKSNSVTISSRKPAEAEAEVERFQVPAGEVSEFQAKACSSVADRLNLTPVVLIRQALGDTKKTAFVELTKDEAVQVLGYGNAIVWKNEANE